MQKMSVVTKSASIFSGTVNATMVAVHAVPVDGSYLKIEIKGGTSNSGTIRIVGNVAGVSTTEDVVFSAARWKVTTNKWDAGTPTITSSGFIDEATVATITIDCCDVSGNKIEWETLKTYPCSCKAMKALGFQYLLQVKQAGTYAPGMYNVWVKGNPIAYLKEGTEFTVSRMNGVFMVSSEVQQHQQSRTNVVDSLNFIAIKRG